MKNETRQERVDRLTAYYVKLAKKEGVEKTIRFLREVIECMRFDNQRKS